MSESKLCDVTFKMKYETQSKAKKHIVELEKNRRPNAKRGGMNCYKCKYCNYFHVGHLVNNKKRENRAIYY